MLTRRRALYNNRLQKEPIFFAPLDMDLLPTIAWNGDKTIYKNIGYSIYGECYSGTSTSNVLLYNCSIPSEKTDLTFSCWIKPTVSMGTIGYAFGATTKNREIGKGCHFCCSNSTYRLDTEWTRIVQASIPAITIGEWQFITFTIKKTDSGWSRKIYKNGILEYEADGQIKNNNNGNPYSGFQDCFFAIGNGSSNGAKNVYCKHFSCFDALTDDEVLALYSNNGVPILP